LAQKNSKIDRSQVRGQSLRGYLKQLYLIDGYNLIFSLIESQEKLQILRQKVIQTLQKSFARKKIRGMIVFDGAHRREEETGLSYASPLTIAYAPKGQTADEYILEQIALASNPTQVIVVTNDKGLTLHARSARAQVLENDFFIHWLQKKKKKSERREPKESEPNIERLLQIFEERLKNSEEF
jgi:predicted RNA-binding protein with PIN domain